MKAKVPTDVPLLVELGSKYPTEVDCKAKEPYSIVILITNGKRRRKFLHINRRNTGIYIAHGYKGGFHESYHMDGTRHWKGKEINEETGKEEDFKIKLPKGPPVSQIQRFFRLHNATAVIRGRALSGFTAFKETEGPFDKIVYLDSRSLPEAINYEIILVEPFRHGLIPFTTSWPLHFQLFTRSIPWIALLIYEQWPP